MENKVSTYILQAVREYDNIYTFVATMRHTHPIQEKHEPYMITAGNEYSELICIDMRFPSRRYVPHDSHLTANARRLVETVRERTYGAYTFLANRV